MTMNNLTGRKFGRWTVLRFDHKNEKRMAFWLCKCDCGKEKVVSGNSLTLGRSLSCGCYSRELNSQNHQLTKDKSRTKIYHCWSNMKKRCYNPKSAMYSRYGARGITVCEEWLNDFNAFYEWAISNGHKDNLSIDRIDLNGNYEPSNCRWATKYEQANNKSINHFIEYKGEKMSLAEWSRKLNVNYDFLKHKVARGYTLEQIIDNL